jgi:hypothetical protein
VKSRFAKLLVIVASFGVVLSANPIALANPTATGVYCAKCGKIHPVAGHGGVVQALATMPTSQGGVANVLSTLNAQRARQGVGQLGFDPTLQAVAEQRAAQMARTGTKSHPPGSFSPGRYEGVGWSSSYSPSGVSACFTSDSRMRVAGAAMATGRDGVYFAVVYR